VTPATAGWRYLSFRLLSLRGSASLETGEDEVVVVPLSGDATVGVDGVEWEVGGPADVFAALPRYTTDAAHGYDLYYLNALAGNRRTMQSADDPDLAWIRLAWSELVPDPRVPLVPR
jgi:5-deoxy-D-glucuronate isomerase